MVIDECEILLNMSEVMVLSHGPQQGCPHGEARHGWQIIEGWCRDHVGSVERVWSTTPDVAAVQAVRFAGAGDLLVFRLRWLGSQACPPWPRKS